MSDATPEIPEPEAGTEKVTLRRAPKIPAFLIVGGGTGAIVTFILTSLFPVDPLVGFGPLFAYFALFGVTGGVLLGAILALIVDRRSKKLAKSGEAEFITEREAMRAQTGPHPTQEQTATRSEIQPPAN